MEVGQVVWGKLRFNHGTMPNMDRPYLIVDIDADKTCFLTISSIPGKEHKLVYKSNYAVKNYNPPLSIPSFVKLDSFIQICSSFLCNMRLSDKTPLYFQDLQYILSEYPKYLNR